MADSEQRTADQDDHTDDGTTPSRKKRNAERQGGKDDASDDDEPVHDPGRGFQKADAETLSKRRILKARRPGHPAEPQATAPTAAQGFAAAFATIKKIEEPKAAAAPPAPAVEPEAAAPPAVEPTPQTAQVTEEPPKETQEQPKEEAEKPKDKEAPAASGFKFNLGTAPLAAPGGGFNFNLGAAPAATATGTSAGGEATAAPSPFTFNFTKAPSNPFAAPFSSPFAFPSPSQPFSFSFPQASNGAAAADGRKFGVDIAAPATLTKKDDEEEDDGEAPDNFEPKDDTVSAKAPLLPEVTPSSGEEHETVAVQISRAKLFRMETSATGAKEYKEKGVGPLRLNVDSATGRARVIMRVEKTSRLIMNVAIFPKMGIDIASDKSFRITGFDPSSKGPSTYLIKVGSRDDTENFVDALKKYRTESEKHDQEGEQKA